MNVLRDFSDQAELVRQFLEEQEQLDELFKMAGSTSYEPVVKTNAHKIHIDPVGVRIDSFVKLEGGTGMEIGRGVHIASFAHLGIGGGFTTIEDYACVASGGRVISGSNRPDAPTMSASAPPAMQHVQRYHTKLKRYSAVLTNATVMPGVTLHEGAVLAAGGVATKDIPAWEVWGGVPARFMFKREVKR